MQPGSSSPKPSLLKKKGILALIILVVAVAGVAGVLAYNFYQKSGTYPFGPNVLYYERNIHFSYAYGAQVELQMATTVQLDTTIISGVGPLNVGFYDGTATIVYINNEKIPSSKSWILDIGTTNRHQLGIDNLDPNHGFVELTVKVTQK